LESKLAAPIVEAEKAAASTIEMRMKEWMRGPTGYA